MSNQTILASEELIDKLSHYYDQDKQAKTPAYAHFLAKKNGVTITAFESGKVLFQGPQAQEEAEQWIAEGGRVQDKKKKDTPSQKLPANFNSLSVIGSDEVATGSYFGPVVVCACYVQSDQVTPLLRMGVRDSKHLSDTKIQSLAKEINPILPHKLLVVSPEKYNEVQAKLSKNKMLALLHNQAIRLLLDNISPQKPDAILIDQFISEKNYYDALKGREDVVNQNVYFATNGESEHLAVAAASILARDQLLTEMKKLSQLAGMDLRLGSGSDVDDQAAQILLEDKISLRQVAKLHFANTQKAEDIADRIRKQTHDSQLY